MPETMPLVHSPHNHEQVIQRWYIIYYSNTGRLIFTCGDGRDRTNPGSAEFCIFRENTEVSGK
jgi:hypothetical protein